MSAFNFEVGQSVEFAWDEDQWYSAVVNTLNDDGSYDIYMVSENMDPSYVRYTEDDSTVELNWRGAGEWFPDYEVTNENEDGTFNLRLLQEAVTLDRLRPMSIRFCLGQTVEYAWDRDQWYPAVIVAVNDDGFYDVALTEENVDPSLIQGDTEVGSIVSLNWRGEGEYFENYEVISVNDDGTFNLSLIEQGVEADELRDPSDE